MMIKNEKTLEKMLMMSMTKEKWFVRSEHQSLQTLVMETNTIMLNELSIIQRCNDVEGREVGEKPVEEVETLLQRCW